MKHVETSARPGAERPCDRLIIGIGELAVSADVNAMIATHAIGSCIAVCVFDPVAQVAGMLHFLLPEASINSARALQQPATFADTGIPLLFQTAYGYGLIKSRAIVKLVGGAGLAQNSGAASTTGRRNTLAARQILWRNGVFVSAEDVGGTDARTVHLAVADGRLRIFNGPAYKEL
jgi:chemotaxis protein CheD